VEGVPVDPLDAGSMDEPLPDHAVVVRGGRSAINDMKCSVARTRSKQRLKGELERPVLSVFTDPELGAEGICAQAPILRGWKKIRVSTVGELRARGFAVCPPGDDGHATLELPDPPTDDDYERLHGAFGEPQENPART
jgi:hypothetical protein